MAANKVEVADALIKILPFAHSNKVFALYTTVPSQVVWDGSFMEVKLDWFEKPQTTDYAKEFDAVRGACVTENNVGAIERWLAGLDFSLPEGRCDEFLVILKTSSQDVFIGRLADVSSQYLIFDYLVLEKTLLGHINSAGEVKLKRDSDCRTTPEPASCIILSDFSIPDGSFFSVPMRRCVLQLA